MDKGENVRLGFRGGIGILVMARRIKLIIAVTFLDHQL